MCRDAAQRLMNFNLTTTILLAAKEGLWPETAIPRKEALGFRVGNTVVLYSLQERFLLVFLTLSNSFAQIISLFNSYLKMAYFATRCDTNKKPTKKSQKNAQSDKNEQESFL